MNMSRWNVKSVVLISLLLSQKVSNAQGDCDNVVHVWSTWPGGYTASLNIPIATNTNEWAIDVIFSESVNSLEVWDAESLTSDNLVFHLTNVSYNGQQNAGAVFSDVGFHAAYPATDQMPNITSVIFNGVDVCSKNPLVKIESSTEPDTSKKATKTTRRPPTTKTRRTTTSSTILPASSTTRRTTTTRTRRTTTRKHTVAASTGCSSVAVVPTSWPGGYTVNLYIPFSSTVTSWVLDITFSAAVTLSVWNLVDTTTNSITHHLASVSSNGQQSAGAVYNGAGFNVAYSSTSPMVPITNILLNGVSICSGNSTTTTSTTPTTTTTKTTTTTPKTTTKTTTTTTKKTTTTKTTTPTTTTKTTTTPKTTAKTTTTPTTTTTKTTTTTPKTTTKTTTTTTKKTTTTKTTTPTTTTKTTTTPTTTTTKTTTTTTTPTTTTKTTTTPSTTTTTTTKSTTTPTTTTTTAGTTTTPAPSGCSSVAVVATSWPGGYTVNLYIPFSSTVTSWALDITFSSAVTLSVWNLVESTSNSITHHLASVSSNGQQNAGTLYNGAGFNVAYPSTSPMVSITSILLNGVNICSGNSTTTTTSSTTSTTSSTTSTTTTTPSTTVSTSGTTTTTTPSPNPTNNTKYNYADVITKSLLFYDAQRSGRLPASNPIPYRGNSALSDGSDNGVDLTGGYYDAGDFVKFNFPMAYSVAVVAWSVIDWAAGYSAAGQLANAQDMVQWGADYFLKCHISSGGVTQRLYGQVGDGNADHAYWGRPEDMTMSRPSFYIDPTHPGSDLAAETAAALAAASIVLSSVNATYAAQCLTAAKQLYTFANQYRGTYDASITNAANFYKSWSGYGDELAWAATWLYRATNTSSYLSDAQSHYTTFGLSKLPGSFSWDDKTAGVQVLLAKLTGNAAYITATKAFCDSNVNQLPKTPKGLVYVSGWGPLRYAANAAMICLMAGDQNMNPTSYRKFAQNQIHYALGDTGRSFVCGFGVNPPVSPHHRSSSCPNRPATCDWNNFNSPSPNPQTLWGALVGGPDASDIYADSRSDYQKNEVACDYNAGFQGAVAGLLKLAVQGIVP